MVRAHVAFVGQGLRTVHFLVVSLPVFQTVASLVAFNQLSLLAKDVHAPTAFHQRAMCRDVLVTLRNTN